MDWTSFQVSEGVRRGEAVQSVAVQGPWKEALRAQRPGGLMQSQECPGGLGWQGQQ